MSENHDEQQQQQQNEQPNIAPPFSPVLIEESKQNSTDYSDYSDDSENAPEKGTLAYLYHQRGIALKAAQKRAAEAKQAMTFDDPKIERNIEILEKKTEELKQQTKEQHLVDGPVERPPPPPGARPPLNGITPIDRDEYFAQNYRQGQKKHAQKGPAGAFTDDTVPSPPPMPDDEDEDEDNAQYLGSLPPNANWGLPHNEYGDPLDTEYEAVDIIGQKTKDKEIWYNVVFKEEKFGHKTHWCKESDCENCPELIKEWKRKRTAQMTRPKSKPKSHDSDPSSASLSSSSSSTEDCTPPPEPESSSSSSTEDFTPPPENSSSSSTEDFTPEPESSSSDSRSDLESCD